MINKHEFLIAVLVLATGLVIYFAWPFLNPPRTWKEVLGKPEFSKVDPDKPLRDQTRSAELAGRTFEIPLMYIDGQLSKGRVQQGINLKYVLPDFQSKWELKTKENYKQAFEDRRFAHMLLEDASVTPNLGSILSGIRKRLAKEEYEGYSDGLHHYKWYRVDKGIIVHRNDVFVELDKSGNVQSFIECSAKLSVPSPSCNHIFVNKGLQYDIFYNRENYFADWRIQREKAVRFIDSFEHEAQQ